MKKTTAQELFDLAEQLHREMTDKAGKLTIPYSWIRQEGLGIVIVVPWSDKADRALEAMKREFPT